MDSLSSAHFFYKAQNDENIVDECIQGFLWYVRRNNTLNKKIIKLYNLIANLMFFDSLTLVFLKNYYRKPFVENKPT